MSSHPSWHPHLYFPQITGAGAGNGTDVLYQVITGHTDTVICQRQYTGFFIKRKLNFEIGVVPQYFRVRQRAEPHFTDGIGSIGNQFAQVYVRIRVQRGHSFINTRSGYLFSKRHTENAYQRQNRQDTAKSIGLGGLSGIFPVHCSAAQTGLAGRDGGRHWIFPHIVLYGTAKATDDPQRIVKHRGSMRVPCGKPALPVTCIHAFPSVLFHTSFRLPEPPVPPITHSALSNTAEV
ncbi:hypothetical protein CHS0354_002091 [Potamilus streckersoni]|uniref:Uncharacterized protein n=1 Tax=Potamilus streckersoni TaxID=2493646 RepID=A0AAE0T6V9_9BIVA|nr:hypothetical protein CHS0354_002091 [Potamilus streckersoni]